MKRSVLSTIKKNNMLEGGDGVIVAVSGGPDSVALLSVLNDMRNLLNLRLVAAHLNHCIRGDAAKMEADFVTELCAKMHVPLEYGEADIPLLQKRSGHSLEETARTERYKFLEKVAQRHSASKIALGHHRRDQAETIMMNILRGSGIRGLRGMTPVRNGTFIRPLLEVSREDILLYLQEAQLPFMTDTSNKDETYLRNRIRMELMPLLRKRFNPSVEEALIRLADIARREDEYLNGIVKELLLSWDQWPIQEEASFSISRLCELHDAIKNRIFMTILNAMSAEGQGNARVHIRALGMLSAPGHGKGSIDLPGGIKAQRSGERLIICKMTIPKSIRQAQKHRIAGIVMQTAERPVQLPGMQPIYVPIPSQGIGLKFTCVTNPGTIADDSKLCASINYERIVPPVYVRKPMHGDRFQPFGMKGTKKLKKYFIDEKVSGLIRKNTLLLVDSIGILWIVGMRMSERCRVTELTGKVLKVEII
jgi:tRNA(Ile)-lysidine synthase